jgi:hypothetical protein
MRPALVVTRYRMLVADDAGANTASDADLAAEEGRFGSSECLEILS